MSTPRCHNKRAPNCAVVFATSHIAVGANSWSPPPARSTTSSFDVRLRFTHQIQTVVQRRKNCLISRTSRAIIHSVGRRLRNAQDESEAIDSSIDYAFDSFDIEATFRATTRPVRFEKRQLLVKTIRPFSRSSSVRSTRPGYR